jgi:hypothetical protein
MIFVPFGRVEEDLMSILDRFQAYADAFEESFVDDDWSHIEPYFTDDAVYEGDPEDAQGRDAILAKLKLSVDAFDRRMDTRTLEFEKPTVDGDVVRTRWSATYTKTGKPALAISGVEVATFEGDRISRLRGEFDAEAQKTMGEWMAAHGASLADE